MPAFGAFVRGGTSYPLPVGTGQSSLRDVDPSMYWTALYFASVLQTYMGARLVAECAAANITYGGGNAITQAVQYFLPYDPLTVTQEQQIGKFPILAIWRTTDKTKWEVIGRMRTDDLWKVAYILPPLTGGQRERLQPILKSIKDILLNRIENMLDPGFMSGAPVWQLAGLEEINLIGGVTGSYDIPQGNITLPCWVGDLQVAERDENVPDAATLGAFSGADVVVTLVPNDGTAPLDLVSFQVNFAVFTGVLGSSLSMLARVEPGHS